MDGRTRALLSVVAEYIRECPYVFSRAIRADEHGADAN
jgi:hypothetical protein